MTHSLQVQEQQNLFQADRILQDKTGYASVNWVTLNDQNQGQYLTNSINFNTDTTKNMFTVLSESELLIPFSLRSTAAFTANTKLAIKHSLLTLIAGITAQTTGGTSLVNSSDGSLIVENLVDNLLTSTNHNDQYAQFGLDRNIPANTVSKISRGAASTSTLLSPSLADRCVWSALHLVSGVYYGQVSLKLKDISDFYAAHSFPVVNLPMNLTFVLPSMFGIQPWMFASNSDVTSPASIEFKIGHQIPIHGFVAQNCRLMLKTVTFNAMAQAKISSMLANGFTKVLQYKQSNLQSFLNQNASNNSINLELTSSVQAVQRLVIFTTDVGAFGSTATLSPGVTNATNLFNVQLQINGQNLYSTNIASPVELYNMFLDNSPRYLQTNSTKMISEPTTAVTYADFLYNYRYLVFDLSTLNLPDPNASISIRLIASVQSAVNYDLYCCFSRLQTQTLTMNSSDVIALVKSGA